MSSRLANKLAKLERKIFEHQQVLAYLTDTVQTHTEIFKDLAAGVEEAAIDFNKRFDLDSIDLEHDPLLKTDEELARYGLKRVEELDGQA